MRYSLTYLADVNAKPREVVGSTQIIGCATDSTKLLTNPTCGSLYYNSQRVSCSEGFCCPCSLDQMLGIGGHQRGEIQCNLFTSLFSNGASVHCVRWGPMWYSLFKIMTPSIESEISVYSKDGQFNLTLNPSQPVASAVGSVNVTARLVGSFEWTRAPTDWGLSSYAAAPNVASSTGPADDPRIKNAVIRDPFKFGMLIQQSATDLSGKTCNKIGVSHSAFVNNQGSRCSGHIGDCLSNQIDDIWASATPNSIPENLCYSIGGSFVHNDGYRLSCQLANPSSDSPTQVLIELNANDVQIVYNISQGVILSVTTTTSIQALVQRISASITFVNTGDLRSQFNIAVSACNPNTILRPLAGSQLALDANETQTVDVKLEDSSEDNGVYNCTATLTDTDGKMLSEMAFGFNITAVTLDRGAQGNNGTKGDTNSTFTAAPVLIQPDPCISDCSGFFSLMCFVGNQCWSKIGTLFGTLAGVSLGLFLLNKFGVVSMIWNAFKSMCGTNTVRKRRNSDIPLAYHPNYNPYPYPPPYNPYGVQY